MPTTRQFKVSFFTVAVIIIAAVVIIWESVQYLTEHVSITMGWK